MAVVRVPRPGASMADRRLHLLVEGPTEQAIVVNVIQPHLESAEWLVTSSILATKRPACGAAHRGGVTSWSRLEREIRRLLHDTGLAVLSTMIDYYGLPDDVPGMSTRPSGGAEQRVEHVEHALADAVGDPRFVPHLTLHESESWVFAAAKQLGDLYGDQDLAARLTADVVAAGGAELVNDDPSTAPSKRLLRYRAGYAKVLDGPLAVGELGLPSLRARCPHLDRWLSAF